jgi:large-conductance mechanosensitive channel
VAVERERGTSFPKVFSNFAANGHAADLANGVTLGAAFSTIVPSIADDDFDLDATIVDDLDFPDLFSVPNNRTRTSVPSLTVVKGEGVATLATA